MEIKPIGIIEVTADVCSPTGRQRKLYKAPYLEELGDLRSITLGGSPGATEMGSVGCSETTPCPSKVGS